MKRLGKLLHTAADLLSAVDWLWRLLLILWPGLFSGIGFLLLAIWQHISFLHAFYLGVGVFALMSMFVFAVTQSLEHWRLEWAGLTAARLLPEGRRLRDRLHYAYAHEPQNVPSRAREVEDWRDRVGALYQRRVIQSRIVLEIPEDLDRITAALVQLEDVLERITGWRRL
jgi:hypothetical protein